MPKAHFALILVKCSWPILYFNLFSVKEDSVKDLNIMFCRILKSRQIKFELKVEVFLLIKKNVKIKFLIEKKLKFIK